MFWCSVGKRGVRSRRGKGEIYVEAKDSQVIVLLTATGKRQLDELARSFGLSRSEFIEQIARGILIISVI